MLGEGRKTWMMLPDLLLVVLLAAVVAGRELLWNRKCKSEKEKTAQTCRELYAYCGGNAL